MGAPYHGYNALIYISGTKLVGGNAWSLNISKDSVVTNQFGDGWKKRLPGQTEWSGSITAWDQGDDKLLMTAATAYTSIALMIYPDLSTIANYYSGNAIFGASSGGGVTSAVSKDGDFVGDDALLVTGFA
jgi:hypothetical protein